MPAGEYEILPKPDHDAIVTSAKVIVQPNARSKVTLKMTSPLVAVTVKVPSRTGQRLMFVQVNSDGSNERLGPEAILEDRVIFANVTGGTYKASIDGATWKTVQIGAGGQYVVDLDRD